MSLAWNLESSEILGRGRQRSKETAIWDAYAALLRNNDCEAVPPGDLLLYPPLGTPYIQSILYNLVLQFYSVQLL